MAVFEVKAAWAAILWRVAKSCFVKKIKGAIRLGGVLRESTL